VIVGTKVVVNHRKSMWNEQIFSSVGSRVIKRFN